jgi:hypothetical protein
MTASEGFVQYTTTTIPVQSAPTATQGEPLNETSNLYSSPYSSMGAYGNFTSTIGSLQNSVPVENFHPSSQRNESEFGTRFTSINSY